MINIAITYGNKKIILSENERDLKEYFDILQTNGSNPHIEKITWEHWTRPITFDWTNKEEIEAFNKYDENSHFIYGYLEAWAQSSDVPESLFEFEGDIIIEVTTK